ncbi:MAG: riboflavin biosynthesis protein RibF [Candidatus Limnocylindria bacterium]
MTGPEPDAARTLESVAARQPGGPAAVVLGVFDGVHRGHLALLSAVREAAAARGARPVALVFDPPPVEVIRPGHVVDRLAPLAENLRLIREAAADPIPVRFDGVVRGMAPEAFLDALAPGLQVVAVVMTPDTAFGRDRSGTPERLTESGPAHGFEVVVIDPEVDDGPISSTRIRRALGQGELAETARLLGRRPALTGTVVPGEGRGRALGFPTANLAFAYRPALPPLGIYAGLVTGVEGAAAVVGALVSIGRRPTFHEDGEVVVEANILDWDGDLSGQALRLELVTRLRDEQRFDSASDLTAQMSRDETVARAALAEIV